MSERDKVLVSFVILTWNSGSFINECVNSYVKSFERYKFYFEFIVIDNGSTDNTTSLVEDQIRRLVAKYCNISLIKLNKNIGTTRSRNIGLLKSRGEFVVICDSDTEFVEGDWDDIFSYLRHNENVGILAPILFFGNGHIQSSVKKFPTIIDKSKKILEVISKKKLYRSDHYEDFPWNHVEKVDSAISACWIMRKSLLDEIGLFDEKIFYSPEDLDYCLRVWEHGKKVVFYPYLKIVHHTQQINHKKPFSRMTLSHVKGLIYYFIKHRYCLSRDKLIKRIMIANQKIG